MADQGEHPSAYRDELAAARARIAVLEERLADAREALHAASARAAREPAASARVQALVRSHAEAQSLATRRERRHAALRWFTTPVVLMTALGALPTALGEGLVPLVASFFVGAWTGLAAALFRRATYMTFALRRLEHAAKRLDEARAVEAFGGARATRPMRIAERARANDEAEREAEREAEAEAEDELEARRPHPPAPSP